MSKPWFATKRDGYPADMPISWKGWAVISLAFAGMMLASQFAFEWAPADVAPFWAAGAMVIIIIGFSLIIRAKTEGGRRRRDGKA